MTDTGERIDVAVGRNLRTNRVRNNLSQTQLGDLLGVTFQQVQKYEKGTNSVPTGRIREVCAILGISPNELFEWEGTASKPSSIRLSTWATKTALKLDSIEDNATKRVVAQLLNVLAKDQPDPEDHAPVAQLVRASRS